jgi:hypothetical protein
MSEIRRRQESILLLDVGTCATKAVLLDLVEGQYRSVATGLASSTVAAPWQDLSLGALQAISRLEAICGRTLLGERETSDLAAAAGTERYLITPEDAEGRGVDRLLVVGSAGPPLYVLLAGLAQDVSLASARRAIESTYAQVQDVIALEQDASRGNVGQRSAGEQIGAILRTNADLVLLVGGTNGGATEPVRTVAREVLRVALYLMGEEAPPVLYAGNPALGSEIRALFDKVARVQVADNVRPAVDVEDVAPAAQELNSRYYEKMRTLPGLRTIRQWSRSLILPTARATEAAIRCCAQIFESDKPALGIDLGAANLALHIAKEHRIRTVVRTDLGTGSGLCGLLDRVEAGEILRWLPFELDETAFLDWFHYKVQHPQTVAQTRRELLIELAAARELLRLGLADLLPAWETGLADLAPACDPLIGSGGLLSHAPHPGLAALVMLDALQPLGVSTLYQDESGLLPAVGSVAKIEPLATVQVLRGEGLLCLGTFVAPRGRAKLGAKALTVRALDPEIEVEQEVRYGELCVIPAAQLEPLSEKPIFELAPTRRFDLGQGPGKSVQVTCKPGALGLVVDARGRPLEWADDESRRREQMDEWLYAMTGERGS